MDGDNQDNLGNVRKIWKMEISTSNWGAQHLNAGPDIQQTTLVFYSDHSCLLCVCCFALLSLCLCQHCICINIDGFDIYALWDISHNQFSSLAFTSRARFVSVKA